MKSENILFKIRRSFNKTTDSRHSLIKYPSLIKNAVLLRINEIYYADITFVASKKYLLQYDNMKIQDLGFCST